MNRRIAILIIIVTGILGTISASAQRKPYTQLMKEIGPTFAGLKKNLDSNAAEAAAQDAIKLEGLFKETEEFWARAESEGLAWRSREFGEVAVCPFLALAPFPEPGRDPGVASDDIGKPAARHC